MHIVYTEYDDYEDDYYLLVDGKVKRLAETDFDILIDDIVNDYQTRELTLFLIKQDSDSQQDRFSYILDSLRNKGVKISEPKQVDFHSNKNLILTEFGDSSSLDRIRKRIENNPHSVLKIICKSEDKESVEPPPVRLPGTSMLYRIIARKYGVNK